MKKTEEINYVEMPLTGWFTVNGNILIVGTVMSIYIWQLTGEQVYAGFLTADAI